MKGKFIVGAVLGVILVAALFYFYGGSQVPFGQPPLESVTAQNVGDIKTQFNLAKDDVQGSAPALADLNGMSAGGLCSREDYPGVCREAGASFRNMGTGAADRLVSAFHVGAEESLRYTSDSVLGQRPAGFAFHG